MKKTRVYSVRLQSLTSISPKAFKATAFDGSTAILPKSQVFAQDYEVQKSEAYWIASWVLEQKDLQYSTKKEGWYNPRTGHVEPSIHIEVERHVPAKLEPVISSPDQSLTR